MKKLLIAISCLFLSWPLLADDNPKVRLDTTFGPIELVLYADRAPRSVENFLRYVNEGFYDGTIFHRVIEDFMIQGGGYTRSLEKKPTHEPIPNEADNGLKNRRGTIAMARTGMPHSATAQFFINTVDNNSLNFSGRSMRGWGYTVFGRVTSGMDVVDQIEAVKTGPAGRFQRDVPRVPVLIKKAQQIQ